MAPPAPQTQSVEKLERRGVSTAPVLPPPVPTVAWSPWLALAVLALALAANAVSTAGSDGLRASEIVDGALVDAWALAGAILVAHPPLKRMGVIVLVAAALGGASFVGATVVSHHWTGLLGELAASGRPLSLGLLPAVGFHFLAALPRGQVVTPARRVSVVLAYGFGTAVGFAWWATRPALPLWPLWAESATVLAVGWPVAARSYASSAGPDRQRLLWIGCAAMIIAEMVLVVCALWLLLGWPHQPLVIAVALTAAVPASLAAGTFSRLVNRACRLLRHTVSVATLVGVVVAIHLVVVLGLGLGREPNDTERRLLLFSMVGAALAAGLYLPVRERLSEAANRLAYGERDAPDEVLETFGSRLTRAIPMDELLLQLAESLRKTMTLVSSEIWTGSGGTLERSVSVPDRGPSRLPLTAEEESVIIRTGVSGSAWLGVWLPSFLEGRAGAHLQVAPIVYSGKLLGLIVVERGAESEAFTAEDKQVLSDLARQVGLALNNLALDSALEASLDEVRRQAEELRASRARIVAAADAERRRIERNLHDGAQQHLVALAVNLRLTRDLAGTDPSSTVSALDELAVDVKATITELRNLAHGIYPPLLADSGLATALRSAAARSHLDVEVHADDAGRYPAEVEAAIYFCCLEALQNAAKHAPRSHVTVQLWEEPGRLSFDVIDDGAGFEVESTPPGHGFTNMGDRLGAIGGILRWDSTPGAGTCISGSVPLPKGGRAAPAAQPPPS